MCVTLLVVEKKICDSGNRFSFVDSYNLLKQRLKKFGYPLPMRKQTIEWSTMKILKPSKIRNK